MASETPEEITGPNDHSQIVKGKRTKRQRPSSSSSSGSGGDGSGGGDYNFSILSPTTSSEISTLEEEDMANCLILLAQGCGPREINIEGDVKVEAIISSRGMAGAATATTTGKAAGGFYIYACKTCDRTFPSFQALGGHRASHKKPKAATTPVGAPQAPLADEKEEEGQLFNKISPILSLQVSNKSCNVVNKVNKVHECSICGSEFSSGQALGGHMRRHRSASTNPNINQITMNMDTSTTSESQETEKPRNLLPLDLNLPAPPEDDHHHRDSSKFQFTTSNQQALVFSAPALVDCHY